MDNSKRTVVVTGFGPFGEHTVNASWVAVQELKKLGLGGEVNLHVSEVPVEYQTVQSLVPSLWKKYHPLLVVHVGVSGMATTVTLEKCGRNHGYKGLDNSSFCPDSQCCIVGGPDCINSVIDMESVCKRVTASGLGVTVSVSKDAGSLIAGKTWAVRCRPSSSRCFSFWTRPKRKSTASSTSTK
ncbi:pyroglutamyl-peptidase 1 isoform X1 [Anarrhichthys ocellatus]|uniref:pyroglutamyl-peptidase 1 isoform X1 n=1 Tax=Anarrhichthys ocellatus TaxID=433405 RepID=UPI0012EE086B|nr:pyroglutamyl-peptidase 1 isoform X1 [Anarrhichthys ocellatus]